MENQQMLPHFVSTLNDFKELHVWQFLTSNGLKYLLGSLILASTFFWSCFLLSHIQLIKPLYNKLFPVKVVEIQKTQVPESTPIPQKEKELIHTYRDTAPTYAIA